MYEIILSDDAIKQLSKLEKQAQERILNALEKIRVRPEPFVAKLAGDKGLKFRVGDYRVILEIEYAKSIIQVIRIGHRKNIYDRMNL